QNFTLGFLLISAVVLVGILIYYWRLPPGDWSARLGLALVFGGAIANAYDRGVKGSVIDFIQVPHWPIFNVADSAIVTARSGWRTLIAAALRAARPVATSRRTADICCRSSCSPGKAGARFNA
ncbi:MAG: signal peptidase II, partial [Chloroflexi bacterium]